MNVSHTNLCILSTLCDSNIDTETGKMHKERVQSNMVKATEIYISRVNGSPCGETRIHLFKGADLSKNRKLRMSVLQFLKGNKSQKERLRQDNKQVYDEIERIWKIQCNHMMKDLFAQYVFYLVCCFKPGCTHPICQTHSSADLPM